jgi:hypothetical protein
MYSAFHMVGSPVKDLDAYWLEFKVSDDDLDFIVNLLLEREAPLTTLEMAEALVEHRLADFRRMLEQSAELELPTYLPGESYKKGQELIFAALGGAVGNIVSIRDGNNPEDGEFKVISVRFDDDGDEREFAAALQEHMLNHPPEDDLEEVDVLTPGIILDDYGHEISDALTERLHQADDIVWIAGRWFPRQLLVEINEGHLNLAEAVLDVSEGGPVSTADLIKQIETPSGHDPLLIEFSVDYALQNDERFDEVGPAGEVLWFLKRLEPQEVLLTPPRLLYQSQEYDRSVLVPELLELEGRLDDELSPPEDEPEPIRETTIPILYPHWRVGALPLSPRLRTLFPTAYEAPRILFILVDGRTGDRFPGWVVRHEGYIYGLANWYKRYDLPPGGLVQVRQAETPGEVILEAMEPRQRNDWIRTVTVDADANVRFTMLKHAVGTAYDELMVVGLLDQAALDNAWLNGQQRSLPLDRLVLQVFRELMKLNPQAAVHAKSLYSGINVIRRLPPAPIFAELMAHPYYEHVGDHYWKLEESGLED